MRSMYKLSNSFSSLSALPASLLSTQFIHLADNSLSFLVGVWLSAEGDAPLRRIALSHAVAFILAHKATEQVIDFQTVLPALLVALGDPDRVVRHQASECVHLLAQLSKAKQASGVYAFDTIYGESTSESDSDHRRALVVFIIDRSAEVPQLGRLPKIYRGHRGVSRSLHSRSQLHPSYPSAISVT
jgi:hypothetical protein